jgi:hypothetical protein
MLPRTLEIGAERQQSRSLLGGHRWRRLRVDPIQPILELRIDRVVLPPRPDRLEARLFERELGLPAHLVFLGIPRLDHAQGGVDAERL